MNQEAILELSGSDPQATLQLLQRMEKDLHSLRAIVNSGQEVANQAIQLVEKTGTASELSKLSRIATTLRTIFINLNRSMIRVV